MFVSWEVSTRQKIYITISKGKLPKIVGLPEHSESKFIISIYLQTSGLHTKYGWSSLFFCENDMHDINNEGKENMWLLITFLHPRM